MMQLDLWDSKTNEYAPHVFITTYSSTYDGSLRDRTVTMDVSSNDRLEFALNNLKEIYKQKLSRGMEELLEDKEYIVGINSNSMLKEEILHHKFLEWDEKSPELLDKLLQKPGLVSETKNGYHYIEESSLYIDNLIELMKEEGCCEGFTAYAGFKKYACLRVSPKEENYIKILKKPEGELYDVYEILVSELEKERRAYNGTT